MIYIDKSIVIFFAVKSIHRPQNPGYSLPWRGGSPSCPHPIHPDMKYPNWTSPLIHMGTDTQNKKVVFCQQNSCKIWLTGAAQYLGMTENMHEKRYQTSLVPFDEDSVFVAGGRIPGEPHCTNVTEMLDLRTRKWTRLQVNVSFKFQ